jgi:hypothetical protein
MPPIPGKSIKLCIVAEDESIGCLLAEDANDGTERVKGQCTTLAES